MPIHVKLPNRTMLLSSETANLAFHNFNPRARSEHIINGLASHSLLPCEKMYDAGYNVLFDEGEAKVIEGNVTVHGRVVVGTT
jgi:hypothetical protein